MTGSHGSRAAPRAVVLGAVSAAVVVLLWAAAGGPGALLSDSGRRRVLTHTPEPTAQASTVSPAPNLRTVTRNIRQTHDLSWLGTLIAWAVLVGAVLVIALALRYLWAHRWRPPEKPSEVAFEVLPRGRLAQALHDDSAAQLAAVAEGSPRNGIVRCWLRLEQTIGEAGLPPGPTETSSEYTVRVLRNLDVDPRAIGRLAGLYREARFSEHPLAESDRTAARAALQQLHSELAELGPVEPAR